MSSGMRDAYAGRMFSSQKGNAPEPNDKRPVRHEDGQPHETHGWVRDEDPDNDAWPWVCGECGVNIEDDEATDPCNHNTSETMNRNVLEGWLAVTIHEELYGESPGDDGPTTMAWRVAAAVADVFYAIQQKLEES